MSVIELQQMSRLEKVRLMEAIWTDLSREDDSVESPAWHKDELEQTEARYAAGLEEVVDWSEAKKELRRRFE
jgi:hypothetical protein